MNSYRLTFKKHLKPTVLNKIDDFGISIKGGSIKDDKISLLIANFNQQNLLALLELINT